MDAQRIALEGLRIHPVIKSLLSILLPVVLYVVYSIDSYAVTNIPSKSLLPSYDFVVIGSGSAGTFSLISNRKFNNSSSA